MKGLEVQWLGTYDRFEHAPHEQVLFLVLKKKVVLTSTLFVDVDLFRHLLLTSFSKLEGNSHSQTVVNKL